MVGRRRLERSRLQKAQAFGLYMFGLAAFTFEVVTRQPDHPYLYFLIGGMFGLPQFIGRRSQLPDDPHALSDDTEDDEPQGPSRNGHHRR